MKDRILGGFADYQDWDKLIADCSNIEGMTKSGIEEAQLGLAYFRELFGKDFLEKGFHERHPLTWEIINRTPLSRGAIAWLAKAVKSLEGQEEFQNITKKKK